MRPLEERSARERGGGGGGNGVGSEGGGGGVSIAADKRVNCMRSTLERECGRNERGDDAERDSRRVHACEGGASTSGAAPERASAL